MFRSLGTRLFASYALVVLLSLFAAALSLMYLLQGYERRLAYNRLSDVAVPLNVYVRYLRDMGMTSRELISYLQSQGDQLDVRIFVVNEQGVIVHDTKKSDSLVGDHLSRPTDQLSSERQGIYNGIYHSGDGRKWIFAAIPFLERQRTSQVEATTIVVAQQDRPFGAAIAELLNRLVVAGLIALSAAMVLAFWISRSLARPLSRLTQASVEMAQGRYDQQVPVEGPEELARLAASFNRMAAEVGRSRRVLREFVANVSHELRTPLTAVAGFVEALQDGTVTDPAGQRQALATVGAETRRLQRLVAQLLDLSRIEAGQILLAWQPVDLASLLNDSIEIFALRADEASIRLRAEIAAPVTIEGDPDRLEQVFNNLIDNALKYTPPGGDVVVRARRDAQAAIVEVTDTGTGIPAADLDRIFERFYRVEKSRSGAGSGLGLAIVQEIVRYHGGQIGVESQEGRGSTFTVRLPLKRAA